MNPAVSAPSSGDDQVHRFGGGAAEAGPFLPERLGGKGAGLARMAAMGLPVPPGFTIPTSAGARVLAAGALSGSLLSGVADGIAHVEAATGKRFGDPVAPLLVSVRSGAGVSMPGMMDTVLNLGLNDATVAGLAAASGDARFAWDSYRRFIHAYAEIVLGLDGVPFEDALEIAKEDRGIALDSELGVDQLRGLVADFKALVAAAGHAFPQDVHHQLRMAIVAVVASWRSERAGVYRRLHRIADDGGTAVTVQAMVFGTMGDGSATGVAFTRDPSTGAAAPCGEYLPDAQGEDIVAGVRTPHYLTRAARVSAGAPTLSMEEAMPGVYTQLAGMLHALEAAHRDMQDVEFTVERGTLWLLQTRDGKRTPAAGLRIAVEMAEAGLITRSEARARVDLAALEALVRPILDPDAPRDVIARGLPASPGVASGAIAFDAATAGRWAAEGLAVILVRPETSPEDIAGMHAACGILTARGGLTSHAAVVARGMGRPCVCAASDLAISLAERVMRIDAAGARREMREGAIVTLDGSTGEVMAGAIATVRPDPPPEYARLMAWAEADAPDAEEQA